MHGYPYKKEYVTYVKWFIIRLPVELGAASKRCPISTNLYI